MVVYGKDAPLPTWQGRAFPHDVLTDYVKSEEAANADPLAPKFLGSDCHHQAPKIRKATPSELDHPPQFSECTKPLLVFTPYVSTYAEYFLRVPSVMRHLTSNGWLDKNISVVVATCKPGAHLTPWQKLLVEPYTAHNVRGWDSFASPDRPHSHSQVKEGGAYRHCFKKVIAAAFDNPLGPEAAKTAQDTYAYYSQNKLLPNFSLFNNTRDDNLKIFIEFRSTLPSYNPHTDRIPSIKPYPIDSPEVVEAIKREKYNIKFSTNGNHCGNRSVFPGVRQILNLQETLDKCNSGGDWVSQMLAGTSFKTVECKAYSFHSNVLEGIAAVRDADVFLSLHGSGEANSLFMKKGKIKIQMRQKEFGTVHGYLSNGFWPRVCEGVAHHLRCWFVNFEEDSLFEPGIYERLGFAMRDSETRRDRHLYLSWERMISVFKDILSVRDEATYRERWKNNTAAMTFFPQGKVAYSCLFCPWLREVAEGEASCDPSGRIHPPGWRENPSKVPPDHDCRKDCPMHLELMNPRLQSH